MINDLNLINKYFENVIIPEDYTQCWTWRKHHDKYGYPILCVPGIYVKSKQFKVHRYSYMLWNRIPHLSNDQFCCHKCDNPGCLNPDHIFVGSALDNMRDKIAKGRDRHLTNEEHPSHKLSDSEVAAIRKLYSTGSFSQKELASQFKCSKIHISQLVRFKRRPPTNILI